MTLKLDLDEAKRDLATLENNESKIRDQRTTFIVIAVVLAIVGFIAFLIAKDTYVESGGNTVGQAVFFVIGALAGLLFCFSVIRSRSHQIQQMQPALNEHRKRVRRLQANFNEEEKARQEEERRLRYETPEGLRKVVQEYEDSKSLKLVLTGLSTFFGFVLLTNNEPGWGGFALLAAIISFVMSRGDIEQKIKYSAKLKELEKEESRVNECHRILTQYQDQLNEVSARVLKSMKIDSSIDRDKYWQDESINTARKLENLINTGVNPEEYEKTILGILGTAKSQAEKRKEEYKAVRDELAVEQEEMDATIELIQQNLNARIAKIKQMHDAGQIDDEQAKQRTDSARRKANAAIEAITNA